MAGVDCDLRWVDQFPATKFPHHIKVGGKTELYLYGSVRWSSWTFWTFLLAGSVLVVEEGGVQETELALEGVLLVLLNPLSSSPAGWMGGDWAGVLADLVSSLSLL